MSDFGTALQYIVTIKKVKYIGWSTFLGGGGAWGSQQSALESIFFTFF